MEGRIWQNYNNKFLKFLSIKVTPFIYIPHQSKISLKKSCKSTDLLQILFDTMPRFFFFNVKIPYSSKKFFLQSNGIIEIQILIFKIYLKTIRKHFFKSKILFKQI